MKRICLYMAVVMLFLAAPAWATTIFTSESSFLGQILPGYYLEDFEHVDPPFDGSQLDATFGPENGFSWEVQAPLGLYSINNALSTFDASDKLFITFSGRPVTATGGVFASTDIDGNIIPQIVTVTLNDGTSATILGSGFLGFTSLIPIISLEVDGINDPILNFPQMDHFYVGAMAGVKVPEPSLIILLGSGLIGLIGLRKKLIS